MQRKSFWISKAFGVPEVEAPGQKNKLHDVGSGSTS